MSSKFEFRFYLTTAILVVGIVAIYSGLYSRAPAIENSVIPLNFEIPEYKSSAVSFDSVILDILGPDRYIYKTFFNDNMIPITMFVAYYGSMEKADLPHSPLVCFTGQGWETEKSNNKTITLNGLAGKMVKANELVQRKLDTNMVSWYWYQTARHTYRTRGIQKIHLFFDKILGRTDHNAFILLTVNVQSGRSLQETKASLEDFVQDSYPLLSGLFIE